jgi:hypothetical protein
MIGQPKAWAPSLNIKSNKLTVLHTIALIAHDGKKAA